MYEILLQQLCKTVCKYKTLAQISAFQQPKSFQKLIYMCGLSILYYKFPLASCSLSKASNSALKFPLPKLFAPFL